jgi:hypothetical protein
VRHVYFVLFCASVTAASLFSCHAKYEHEPPHLRGELRLLREHMGRVVKGLEKWHERQGRWPTNGEGLTVLHPKGPNVRDLRDPEQVLNSRLGGDPFGSDRYLFLSDAGLLTPHLVPYLYENRNDAPPGAFEGSPVEDDGGREWSAAVADGIYVWSVDGRKCESELSAIHREMALTVGGSYLATVVFAILWMNRRLRDKARPGIRQGTWYVLRGIGGTLLFLFALLVGPGTAVTCYMMRHFWLGRRPALAAECERILDFYRDRGVLSPEAHDRFVMAIRDDGAAILRAREER